MLAFTTQQQLKEEEDGAHKSATTHTSNVFLVIG